MQQQQTQEKTEKIEKMLDLSRYRIFTKKGEHPFDDINWIKKDVHIKDTDDNIIWEQKDVEAPDFWSETAISIAASKYFFRAQPETSIKQLITRVALTIRQFGETNNYFRDAESAQIFEEELIYLLVNQYAFFNSPVWFNCGLYHLYDINDEDSQPHYHYDFEESKIKSTKKRYEYPQNSACFIQSVDDSLDSMMKLQQSEVSLFKFGSGSGTNFSNIRAYKEKLSSGGVSSGVISFLRGFDSWAGSIKSGGTTRRSAKMVLLDVDHPEIIDFIEWKVKEEEKAQALISAGYDDHFTGEAYSTVSGQNSNNSVRVTDRFMEACVNDYNWYTFNRADQAVNQKYRAQEILKKIATAAWKCADPGIQFQDTINKWHTCKNSGPINASNPCSEYLFLDDSACNLASLNLLKFKKEKVFGIELEQLIAAVSYLIIAMDIIVDLSSYPTEQIAQNSHDYRPLGLGYANLGGLLMREGIPYDSELGRLYASMITALLTANGYKMSHKLAGIKGAFEGFEKNKESMYEVINLHAQATRDVPENIKEKIIEEMASFREYMPEYHGRWQEMQTFLWSAQNTLEYLYNDKDHNQNGFRNSQISVIAPTGTIGLVMDCATTGIEPDFSLIKYKQLSDGGSLAFVNSACEELIREQEPNPDQILKYIQDNNTVVDAPGLSRDKYAIFDCAVGKRSLSPDAHLNMMAAVQPFVSGAISKTVNLPTEATIEDIEELYFRAWKLGLKCVAIYRDGCKLSQPLNATNDTKIEKEKVIQASPEQRKRLPDTRQAIAHKFEVGGQEVYMHIGLYEDGTPGEVFLRASKEGTIIKGLLDHIAVFISLGLQHGIPLESIIRKLRFGRFEPYGFTNNSDIPTASSLLDYVGQYLEKAFLEKPENANQEITNTKKEEMLKETTPSHQLCILCGSQMVMNGSCYYCQNCGGSSGCS